MRWIVDQPRHNHMLRYTIVGAMLITFGVVAIYHPTDIGNLANNYSLVDLIRGWGIYATALGCMLVTPCSVYWDCILMSALWVSILWHVDIVRRTHWTRHHIHSIVLNSIGMGVLIFLCPQAQK